VNFCARSGYLVDGTQVIPTDPTDIHVEDAPIVGCSHLWCSVCRAAVRDAAGLAFATRDELTQGQLSALYQTADLASSSLLHRGAPAWRLYLCRCSRWLETSRHACVDRDPDEADPNVPWRCAGHPPLTLPADVDGTVVTTQQELRELAARGFHDLAPPRVRPADRERAEWLARLATRLSPSDAAVVRSAALAALEDAAPRTRGLALRFFRCAPSEQAHARVLDLYDKSPNLFVGVVDEVTTIEVDTTLAHTAWRILGPLLGGAGRARDRARSEALAGTANRAAYDALAKHDSAWMTSHAEDVARAAPGRLQELFDSFLQFPDEVPFRPLEQRIRHALASPASARTTRRERNMALEAAIEVAPDDASAYVAYGGWLAERGDPRAELIARQAAGAESSWVSRFVAEHSTDLLGELSPDFSTADMTWHLGFVRTAKLEVESGVRAAELVLAFLGSPSGCFLRELKLDVKELEASHVAAILASGQGLALLSGLTIMNVTISDDLCLAILRSPIAGQLEEIDLIDSNFSESGARAFVAMASGLRRIRQLHINPTGIDASVLERMRVACPALGTERHAEAMLSAVMSLARVVANLERANASTAGPEPAPFFTPSGAQALARTPVATDAGEPPELPFGAQVRRALRNRTLRESYASSSKEVGVFLRRAGAFAEAISEQTDFTDWNGAVVGHGDNVVRAAIAPDPALPFDELAPLLEMGDLGRLLVARHPATTPAIWLELATDANEAVQLAIADRNGKDASVQMRLAESTHPWIRSKVARETELDAAVRAVLAEDVDGDVRSVLASRSDLDDALLARLLDDDEAEVRQVAVRHVRVSAPSLARLADDPDDDVVRGVALHATTPSEVLVHIAAHTSLDVRKALLQRSAIPDGALEKLASDAELALSIAKRPSLSRSVCEVCARSDDPKVRAALAANQTLEPAALALLVHDQDVKVRDALAENPQFTALAVLALDHESQVRQRLAMRSDLPADLLDVLARDTQSNVRAAVARSPLTPSSTLARLANDTQWEVRDAAKRGELEHPKRR
jgi:uncharacterized protein (TIGR02996 family)